MGNTGLLRIARMNWIKTARLDKVCSVWPGIVRKVSLLMMEACFSSLNGLTRWFLVRLDTHPQVRTVHPVGLPGIASQKMAILLARDWISGLWVAYNRFQVDRACAPINRTQTTLPLKCSPAVVDTSARRQAYLALQ